MKCNEEAVMALANLTTPVIERNYFVYTMVVLSLLSLSILFMPKPVEVPARFLVGLVMEILRIVHIEGEGKRLQHLIEVMINSKIEHYHLKTLEGIVAGFQTNLVALRRVWRDFDNAPPDNRERQGELLRSHHNALLLVVRTAIPHYQMPEHAVAALPDFAIAANIHLVMLVEALKHGKSWGYSDEYIDGFIRTEFNEKTGSGTKAPAVRRRRSVSPVSGQRLSKRDGEKMQMQLLSSAIKEGEAQDWSAELLETWRNAYSALSVQRREVSAAGSVEALDYPTYARNTYERGRKMVVPPKPRSSVVIANPGIREAMALRAYAEYDAIMITHVLSYAEYWPYLTGEFDVPQHVIDNLDREIFSGPYGRWSDWAPWSATQPPPVTVRRDNITSLIVRENHVIQSVRQKLGRNWGFHYGSETAGKANLVDLGPDEFIQNIDLTYGYKVGSLKLTTNEGSYGPFGTANSLKWEAFEVHNSPNALSVSRSGYGLSSVYITRWSDPSTRLRPNRAGADGIFFGFRPLYLATDSHVPCHCLWNWTDNPLQRIADKD